MPKRGIKVKELARILGVTSRQLIDRCRAEGMSVQNSITRLSPQLAERARSFFTRPDPASPPEPATPVHPERTNNSIQS